MRTSNPTDDDVEWQRVKAAILRIEHTTREISLKLSHLIEQGADDAYRPRYARDDSFEAKD